MILRLLPKSLLLVLLTFVALPLVSSAAENVLIGGIHHSVPPSKSSFHRDEASSHRSGGRAHGDNRPNFVIFFPDGKM